MLSSWINQDPLLVFRMAAVPEGGRDEAMKEGCLQEPWNHKLQAATVHPDMVTAERWSFNNSAASCINPFMLIDVAQAP